MSLQPKPLFLSGGRRTLCAMAVASTYGLNSETIRIQIPQQS